MLPPRRSNLSFFPFNSVCSHCLGLMFKLPQIYFQRELHILLFSPLSKCRSAFLMHKKLRSLCLTYISLLRGRNSFLPQGRTMAPHSTELILPLIPQQHFSYMIKFWTPSTWRYALISRGGVIVNWTVSHVCI